jgi:O-antigen/teichoic acid export membrane protein
MLDKSHDNKQLEALQFLGLITKFVLVAISVIQGAIVIRILTTSEYGLIGLVLAVASIVGTYQHLGLGIGTLREISIARDTEESSKIFVTSISARLIITLPIALCLFFLSNTIAIGIYKQPELVFGIKVTSFIVLANGIQEIGFNVLNGLQKFRKVFVLQILNSLLSLFLVVGMIYLIKYNGYFVGNLVTTVIFCFVFIIFTYFALGRKILFPTKDEFKKIFKSIFSIGVFIYLAKIMFGFFNQSGILFLGYFSNNTEVGYLRFAISFGSYSLIFSNAVGYINIPIMSRRYKDNLEKYKIDLKSNFTSLFFGTFFAVVMMVLFSHEAILILAGKTYLVVQPVIIISVIAFFIYMIFELLCTSIFLSSDDMWGYLYSYIILITVSVTTIFILVYFGFGRTGALTGMLLGTLATLIFAIVRIRAMLKISVFNRLIGIIVLIGIPVMVAGVVGLNVLYRFVIFMVFLAVFWAVSQKYGILNVREIIKNSFLKVKYSLLKK